MQIRKLTTIIGISGCLVLALGLFGCSTDSPLSPANPDSKTVQSATLQNEAATSVDASFHVQSAGASMHATARESAPMGGEMIEAAAIEFVGVIGEVSIENSTIQFWNQDAGFAVVLGHVTEDTELIDADGNPVNMEDFTICFSANVVGDEVGENEINLALVEMIAF